MKKTPIVILSLFDGIGCGHAALKKINPDESNHLYYASEVDDKAIKISLHNHPNTIQLGDVRNITRDMIPYQVSIVMGGSPCQCLSFAGKRKGLSTVENIEVTSLKQYLKLKKEGFEFEGQSYLYWEFVRIVDLFKPQYFLLENVLMPKKWKDVISDGLGVEPIRINSSLVSAQNRDRLYWTNIPGISIPEDKGILLSDVIYGAEGCGERGVWNKYLNKYVRSFTVRKDGKANCLVTTDSPINKYILPDGTIHKFTVAEWEVLQTLEKGYTDVPGLTKTARIKGIGNGWTVDVITHIFNYIPELK